LRRSVVGELVAEVDEATPQSLTQAPPRARSGGEQGLLQPSVSKQLVDVVVHKEALNLIHCHLHHRLWPKADSTADTGSQQDRPKSSEELTREWG
jgi:hypothetical protein